MLPDPMASPDAADVLARLYDHYRRVNADKFDGLLPLDYRIELNPNLRRLTGRITYGLKLIEISRWHYLHYGLDDALATLDHELLHLYLHTLGKPSGHNLVFKRTAETLGIRVFHDNPYPRNRVSPHRYVYECPACRRMVFRKRRRDDGLACGVCCRVEAGGRWDARFQLRLVERVRFA
jgi:predicted SprT family Zn-dependent metalloprotease